MYIVIECNYLNSLRQALFGEIVDILDVQHSVDLFSLRDSSILAIMLAGHWNARSDMDDYTYKNFLLLSSFHIYGMVNYP